ncbi:ATP-binding protein [Streptomyces cocklensis]|uniref:DNA replication protein DnaC n=1 Tax=Actinacidiphila cocklensis TaxID=887465 RepID=A0A9W4DWC7_9ACTN|nr:ATP-binding protein [Actinacidiphila cocklensis]MDD1059840.1 ATP-binding protein [Actinacidiphila cocklensis]CAG6397131.1 DNA replication protein DnaC [Actinacidiphila cocklensis]
MMGYLDLLDLVLSEELAVRDDRRFRQGLRLSRLPHQTLDKHDFPFQPDLEPRKVKDLATLSFPTCGRASSWSTTWATRSSNAEKRTWTSKSISKRYEKGSIIPTSNKTFGEWGQMFGDEVLAAAILDRLLHHCDVISINGPSYRLKNRLKAIERDTDVA